MVSMTNKERVELVEALIYIGMNDKAIIKRFSDFEDFSEKKTKEQLAMLRGR